MYEITPDFSIPLPDKGGALSDFKEKVEAACRTAALLGLDEEPDAMDLELAEDAAYSAVNPDADTQKHALQATQDFRPATYGLVNHLLKEYSVRVVENATQIRLLVTNKLILESDNPDPRIRMRALELLGKITDVGLFTEKSEVTVTHRSTEDLVASIRNKIAAMREPKDITPVDETPVIIQGEAVDVSKELGL